MSFCTLLVSNQSLFDFTIVQTSSNRNRFTSTDTMISANTTTSNTSGTTITNGIHMPSPFVYSLQPFCARLPIHMRNYQERVVSSIQQQNQHRTFHMTSTQAFYPFAYEKHPSLQHSFLMKNKWSQMQRNGNALNQKAASVVHTTPIAHAGIIPRTVTPTEHDAKDPTCSRVGSPKGRTIHHSTPTSASIVRPSHVHHRVPNVSHEMRTDREICHVAAALIGLANTPVSPDDVKSIASMKIHNAHPMVNGYIQEKSHRKRFVPSFRPSKDERAMEFIHEYQTQSPNSTNDSDSLSTSDLDCGNSYDTSEDEKVEEWSPSNTGTGTTRTTKTGRKNGSRLRLAKTSSVSSFISQNHCNAKRKVRSSTKRRAHTKHYMLKPKRPNPNATKTNSSKKDIDSQKEVVLCPTQTVRDFPTKLSLVEDEKMVNLLHCYVRSNLLEIVICNRSDPSKKLYPGRVGLQCVYCKKAGDDTSRTSIVYPRSLALLYRAVCGWQRTHVTGDKANAPCGNIPKDVMNHYQYCKDIDKTRGRVAYWEQSARLIGLKDTNGNGVRCEGIVFAKN